MKAYLVEVDSPDVTDLAEYLPPGDAFCVYVQLTVAPEGPVPGGDLFGLTICSPAWLSQQALPMSGRHMLICERFDWSDIHRMIVQQIEMLEAPTWRDLATTFGRFAHWEFEDYRPAP